MKNKIEKRFTWMLLMLLIASGSIYQFPVRVNSSNVNDSLFSIPTASVQDIFWASNSSEWTEVAPEEQGLNSSKISELFEHIENNSYDIQSVIIVRNGYLLTEEYFHESEIYRYIDGSKTYYGGETLHSQQSATKSLISILIGIALQEGFLDNLSHTLYEFYADVWDHGNPDSTQMKTITIEQLLKMNAGFLGGGAGYPIDAKTQLNIDCIRFALEDVPLKFSPGQPGAYEYSNDGVNLLSGIIANVSGMSTPEFAQEYLFTPLGISEDEYYWWSDDQGMYFGGYGFDCTPKVQAKLGILALNIGNWNGIQLVDLNFMRNAIKTQVDLTWNDYGYLWWIMDGPFSIKGFSAIGAGGQSIYVIPDYNIVIAFTASLVSDVDYDQLILDYILQFVEIDPPEEPEDPAIPGINPSMILIMIFGATTILIQRRKKKSD